jgi:MFS family permease
LDDRITPISIFRSLRHRNFRLYFLGQLVSLNGTWMQNVAQAWLVYRLTQSSFMLGLVAFCSLFPVLLFGLYGGVLADRFNRWRLLVLAHSLAMVQAFALAFLTLGGWIAPWHIILLSLLLGIIHALEMPSRHSFVAEMVPRKDLSNAIALNSSAFNVARFLGPSVAGWLVALYGEGWVFVFNGFSFAAILLGLLSMRLEPKPPRSGVGSAAAYVGEGLRFAWHQHHVRAGLLLIALVSVVAASTTVLMPVFAKQTFAGGSETLGILLGAMGVGSLLGALKLAQRTDHGGIDRSIGLAGVVAGIALLVFAGTGQVTLALPVLAVIGFCQTTLVASTNTLIQLLVPDALRGRTMSLFSMIFIGLMPLGSLTAGTLAHYSSASLTITGFGALCVAGSLTFLVRTPRFEDLVDPGHKQTNH